MLYNVLFNSVNKIYMDSIEAQLLLSRNNALNCFLLYVSFNGTVPWYANVKCSTYETADQSTLNVHTPK